ncbi:kinase-like protein, partial [Polychaeton citri CBS 116435]
RALKTSALVRHNTKGLSMAGYDCLRILGRGSFGIVQLVTERNGSAALNGNIQATCMDSTTKQQDRGRGSCATTLENPPATLYAMKIIRKSNMLRNCQEGHLQAERDFLVAAEGSQWTVPLIASFQDNTNLYLVMDYMVGGDFLGLLLREDMILCIEEAHNMGWIHRDIKPDNFLIDSHGHLRIADFGLAFDGHWAHSQSYYSSQRTYLLDKLCIKIDGDDLDMLETDIISQIDDDSSNLRTTARGFSQARIQQDNEERGAREGLLNWRNRVERRKLAKSVVGTSQYMAPEVIVGQPYDGRCDWWSIGVVLYECLYGRTPFWADDRERTKENIINFRTSLTFPYRERWSRPNTEQRRLLDPPSLTATDFLKGILTDRESRISSKQYRVNERNISRRISGISSRISPTARHVYQNDAEEIKAHPFFRGIPWKQMQKVIPPFVPRVKEDQPITKYFEDEKAIRTNGNLCQHKDILGSAYEGWRLERMAQMQQERRMSGIEQQSRVEEDIGGGGRRRKEKKRARDKMLRDHIVGKRVLELRRQRAFFGYTYRRPESLKLEELQIPGGEVKRGDRSNTGGNDSRSLAGLRGGRCCHRPMIFRVESSEAS